MVSLKRQIFLITGANTGIGKQLGLQLAEHGATVLIHTDTAENGRILLNELRNALPEGFFDLFIADLTKRDDIRKMVTEIGTAYGRLDVLINNATSYSPARKLSNEGVELTLAVNYLAAFLLCHLLLPLLKVSKNGSIINIGSHAHYTASFDMDNLQGEKHYRGIDQYSISRLCCLLFTYELAERLSSLSIMVNAVHPGLVATGLYTELLTSHHTESPVVATDTVIYLCTEPEVRNVSGEFFMMRLPLQSSYNSYKRKYRKQLWNYSESLTGIKGSASEIPEIKQRFIITDYLKKVFPFSSAHSIKSNPKNPDSYLID